MSPGYHTSFHPFDPSIFFMNFMKTIRWFFGLPRTIFCINRLDKGLEVESKPGKH